MANEFRVRKKLIVNGSGSVILDIQGSQGQLFSVTDSLSGSLFSVKDISGIPVIEAFSDDTVNIGTFNAEAIKVSGSFARVTGSLLGTSSWANNATTASYATNAVSASYFSGSISSAITALTASYVNPLNQTVTITGSLNITGSTTQVGNNSLLGNTTLSGSIIISGALGTNNPTVKIYGDTQHNGYIRFDPVSTNINQSLSASYIYVSGSTNDLYFTQNGQGYNNTTRLRWIEGNLYTGLLSGGVLSSTLGSTTFNLTSGSGIIVNLNASTGSADPYPTIQYVKWGNYTNVPITNSGSAKITYISIDSTGAIQQQIVPIGSTDITQWDTQIELGVILHLSGSVSTGVYNAPQVSYGVAQRTDDFVRAFGPLKISGHTLQASGSTLGLIKTSGTSYNNGANYINNPNHPSLVTDNAVTTSKIYRYYVSGSTPIIDTGVAVAGYTTVDLTQYNNNGVLASVPGGQYTIQRVFWIPNSPTNAFIVYYGNAYYNSAANAQAAIQTEVFTEAPNTAQNGILLGYIIAQSGETNLTNATIVQGGLFRSINGIGNSNTTPVSNTLSGLSDVSVGSRTSGDLLVYNGSQWVNSKSFSSTYNITGSLNVTSNILASTVTATSFTGSGIANPSGDIILTPMSASINTGSVEVQGGLKWKRTSTAVATEIGDLITFGGTMGLIEGGGLTTSSLGGLVAQAGEAVMYTMTTFPYSTHNLIKYDTRGTTDTSRQITLPQTSSVYVYYNNSGTLTYAATAPSSRSNIILGKATTDDTKIIYIDASQINAHHYSNYVDRMLREALGPIFSTGGIVTQGTTSGSLNVTAATYFFSQNRTTTTGGTPITFDSFYKSATAGQYTRITGSTLISTSSYDSGSGTLVSIPTGKYVKHSLYLLGNNSLQTSSLEAYMMVYGQTLYDTVGDAQAGSLPSPPSFFTDSIAIIASLVVTPASQSIQAIIDERPRLGFVSPSKTGVITAHGDLTGLLNDDHPQYLLVDGTRQMTGNFGLGGYNIYNANNISASSANITSITGSLLGTASYYKETDPIFSSKSASLATTGSNTFIGTQTITGSINQSGSLNINGTITATTLIVQTITSSQEYSSGSNIFGNNLSNTQIFTGSVSITGSLSVNNSSVILANQTSSFVTNSQTSSFVTNAQTGSFVTNAQTGSFVTNAQTSSFVTNAQTGSFITNSQTSSFVTNTQTGSFVTNTQTSSFVTNAQTSSFVTTGSNTFRGNQTITGSLLVTGSQTITGSITSTLGFTGSLLGTAATASYYGGSVTSASYASSSTSASYASTSSYIVTAQTASYYGGSVTSASYASSSTSASYASTASYINTLNQNVIVSGALTLYGINGPGFNLQTQNSSLILQGAAGGGIPYSAQLRITANNGAWTDGVTSSYFQIKTTGSFGSNNYVTFQGGTYGADAPFDRLQFASYYFTHTNGLYGSTPVPLHVVEMVNVSASVPVLGIRGAAGQTANYVNINASGSATGSLLSITKDGVVMINTTASSTESNLFLGGISANEGGQLTLQAGLSYTSGAMLDNYQDRLRILRGSNTVSNAEIASWNLTTKQFFLPAYTGSGAFPGTAAAYLAINSTGDVITVSGSGGSTTPGGSNTQIQYNNSNAFGGVPTLTYDGTTLRATGSFTGSLTGSLFGTASFAFTASYIITAQTASYYGGSVTSASYASSSTSASFSSTASYIITAQTASYYGGSVTSASYASSSTSASYARTASIATSASYALSASWAPGGGGSSTITIADDNIVQGTATYLNFGTNLTATVSANTASINFSGTTGGGLTTKSNQVTSGSFTGSPRKATVTFSTPFTNNNYGVVVTGGDLRSWTIENKVSGSFVINSNSTTALTGNTYWVATAFGESA